jgi:hypothetical protein
MCRRRNYNVCSGGEAIMAQEDPKRKRGTAGADPAPKLRVALGNRWREKILGNLAMVVAGPVIGLIAGFLLLFGGIFLAVAWQAGPQSLIDSTNYDKFTGTASGRIVESWVALEPRCQGLCAGGNLPEHDRYGLAEIAPMIERIQ